MHQSSCFLLIFLSSASGSLESQECPRGVAYIGLQGSDTITTERVFLSPIEFSSVVRGVGAGPLLKYHGLFTSEFLVESMTVDVWLSLADSTMPAAQHASVTFKEREVTAVVSAPSRGIQSQQDSIPEGTLPYMTGAAVFLELLNARSRYLKLRSVSIPVVWLFTGGALDTVHITTQPKDSIIMSSSQTGMAGRIDKNRLLQLSDTKGWSIRQVGCVMP